MLPSAGTGEVRKRWDLWVTMACCWAATWIGTTGEGPWREIHDCLEPEDDVVGGSEEVVEGGGRGCEVDIPEPAVGNVCVVCVFSGYIDDDVTGISFDKVGSRSPIEDENFSTGDCFPPRRDELDRIRLLSRYHIRCSICIAGPFDR